MSLRHGDRPFRIVSLGAGFGGLEPARDLRRALVEITPIDLLNHHRSGWGSVKRRWRRSRRWPQEHRGWAGIRRLLLAVERLENEAERSWPTAFPLSVAGRPW